MRNLHNDFEGIKPQRSRKKKLLWVGGLLFVVHPAIIRTSNVVSANLSILLELKVRAVRRTITWTILDCEFLPDSGDLRGGEQSGHLDRQWSVLTAYSQSCHLSQNIIKTLEFPHFPYFCKLWELQRKFIFHYGCILNIRQFRITFWTINYLKFRWCTFSF